ncbi:Hypothetical_protein [Hexamita inflata]|uniref:Hypothetical_protein n=1 Tax=Hexamita inflata TaxID=28002 RepID=A0ABP1H7P2_9EUKA
MTTLYTLVFEHHSSVLTGYVQNFIFNLGLNIRNIMTILQYVPELTSHQALICTIVFQFIFKLLPQGIYDRKHNIPTALREINKISVIVFYVLFKSVICRQFLVVVYNNYQFEFICLTNIFVAVADILLAARNHYLQYTSNCVAALPSSEVVVIFVTYILVAAFSKQTSQQFEGEFKIVGNLVNFKIQYTNFIRDIFIAIVARVLKEIEIPIQTSEKIVLGTELFNQVSYTIFGIQMWDVYAELFVKIFNRLQKQE